ncbi:MAG TPA: hypothetical protein PKA13_12470 [Geminicoccaceae bacterium]|nr:hypothetical protein [Geminicoccus sp.]HMU50581.1 hypothetical protein [Geminicoccaceae bacterium]
MTQRLRVAVLVPGVIEEWHLRCMDRLRTVADVSVETVGDPGSGADLVLALDPRGVEPSAGRLGTLAFLFGEPPAGLPPGWDEVRRRLPTTACRLVLVRPGRGAEVLRHAVVQTSPHSVTATARRVLDSCIPWPAQVVLDLLQRGDAALEGPAVLLPPASPPPGRAARLHAAASASAGASARLRRMASEDHWAIGIVGKPAAAFLDDPTPSPVRWLPEVVPGGYLADPFPVEHDGRAMLLAEGYDYRDRLGYLAAIDPQRPERPPLRMEVPVPGHLSYPLPVVKDGVLHIVPESHQARRVVLLRAGEPFPVRWETAAVLLDGFAGVDCTPVEHDGRWWLFCADNDDQDQTKLFLFMAEALEGPWRPHPQNPVKIDCRTSRPGGRPFVHGGSLYRPAQDCSLSYGGAIVLNRVVELTPHRFVEEVAARIEPDPNGPYPHGLHHFVPWGDVTVIDGNRRHLGAGTVARWLSYRLRSRSAR